MKAIHNENMHGASARIVVVNIIKSKNESNSQLKGGEVDTRTSCCKYH
ncbi:Uncharacterised protein [Sphingobacterium spiritivorum]|uniref:Uncharacterized protein n=1 Tax=Sphingobacterium spiritivorum TaxID=258 RepID=A0A380BLZ5_SPHSI|nr:Uncharacterised protein [Sphingobacterium spiritivorum]